MQRARRSALVAVLALLAAVALAGCRSQPSVAAYVGDVQITNSQVEKILDRVRGEVAKGGFAVPRTAVVLALVKQELAKGALKDLRVAAPPVDAKLFAQEQQLPEDWGYTTAVAESEAYLAAAVPAYLRTHPAAGQPVEADLREAYANLRINDQPLPSSITYEQVRPALDSAEMKTAAVQRAILRDAMKKHPVRLNPRYGESSIKLQFPVRTAVTSLDVPLKRSAAPVVVDRA